MKLYFVKGKKGQNNHPVKFALLMHNSCCSPGIRESSVFTGCVAVSLDYHGRFVGVAQCHNTVMDYWSKRIGVEAWKSN